MWTIISIVYLTISGLFKSVWWIGLMLMGKWNHPELRRLEDYISGKKR